jgi:hypothetical protein
MPSDEESSLLDQIKELRTARHEKFCVALPFPRLDWTNKDAVEGNLAELRDYAEQLANSALDWYLDKKTSKKRFARCLHNWTYFFGILAALIPLLKISTLLDLALVKQYFGPNASSGAAEASLALIGLAGGLTLIDRTAGFTADWMRYITTASRINRALIEFQFKWNKLDYNSPCLGASSIDPPQQPAGSGKKTPEPDPVAQRIELAYKFCLEIFDLTGQETSIWADELKERVAQMASQFPHRGKS